MADDARPESADEILIVLTRASPGAVERDEILAEVGLDTDEVREGLAYLESEDEIEETSSGAFKWKEEGSSAAAEGESDSSGAALGDGDDEAPGPALDAHTRSTFEVVCSFRRVAGENSGVAIQKSQAIADEIGNALAAAFPRLEWHVEMNRVEAYDQPRVIWPPSDESG